MEPIDLDAPKAARVAAREAGEEAPTVKFGGKVYTLPVEMPAALLTVGESGSVFHIAQALFGEDWEEVLPKLSIADFTELVKELNRVYGVSAGESSASGAS